MNRLSEAKRVQVVTALVEGVGINATSVLVLAFHPEFAARPEPERPPDTPMTPSRDLSPP